MKIAIFLDEVSQAIDNSMQWSIMNNLHSELVKLYEVIVIDPLKLGLDRALRMLLDQDYDVLITYNKTGTNLINSSTGKNVMSTLEKPQISWLTEHPVTFYDQYYQTNSDKRNYIFTNPRHNYFANEMEMQGNFTSMLFASSIKKNYKNYKSREFDICIAAQWRGPADSNNFWHNMGTTSKKFFEDINTLQHLEDGGDVYTAFIAASEHHRIPIRNNKDFAPALKALYWHARKTERIKLVQDLVATGLKISIIGSQEWKQVLPEHNNVKFLNYCTHEKLIEYYSDSRAVASVNCYNGANERTFDALSCGSISIAEDSPTLKSKFNDLEDIFFYERLSANKKIKNFSEILKDVNLSEKIAQNGFDKFLREHTWKNRVIELSNFINDIIARSSRSNHDELKMIRFISNDVEQGASSKPLVYQSYIGEIQKGFVSTSCVPFDASYNTTTDAREYKLFKDLINKNKDIQSHWGLISWKFQTKTMLDEKAFIDFSKKHIKDGYDCVFINPMIGNEAIFMNVWEQGQIAHPNMTKIVNFLNGYININDLSGDESFSFCNYFIGSRRFWQEYISFVDEILSKLDEKSSQDIDFNQAWNGTANYKKDKSVTMRPFVIERLFSSFLKINKDIKVIGYKFEKKFYTRKFGETLGHIIYTAHKLKNAAINEPSNFNLSNWDTFRKGIIHENLLQPIIQLDDVSFCLNEKYSKFL